MTGGRYKHVASRFKQWRILPADCKSWLERRGDDAAGGAEADTAASGPTAATSAAAAATVAGRMNSDLPENVTEERLYQSRLHNLALERHKMIQESDYVRNQFIDHQVRKARSKSLSRLLQGMDIEQYRNKSASGVEKLHQRSAHARLMILATKLLGLSIDEISKFSEEDLRLRLNIPSTEPGTAADAADAAEVPFPAPALAHQSNPTPLRPSTSRASVRFLHAGQFDPSGQLASTPMATRRGSGRQNSIASSSLLPRVGNSGGGGDRSYRRLSRGVTSANPFRPSSVSVAAAPTLASTGSQPDRRPRTASARRRVQSDPRCVQLINSLTPRYKPTSKTPDVGAIIRANPSLFQPTSGDAVDEEQLRLQQQRQKAAKVRRTRREALEVLDSIARTRYYEAGNLATLG